MNRLTLRRRVKAQSLTELALLMPLLALLLIALIELGFLLHAHVQVAAAAREAARAASLYSSTRYSAFDDNDLGNLNNPPNCSGFTGIAGWPLQMTVEQAVVRREMGGDGCPDADGAIVYSALGRLDPAQSATAMTSASCPTGDTGGWAIWINTTFSQSSDGEAMPLAGQQATLTLCYPHDLIIAAPLFNYYGAPVWIGKSVVFQYQQ